MEMQNAVATPVLSADKLATLQSLLTETGFAATPRTINQEKAAQNPNGAPGLASGIAGQPSSSPSWNYSTSSLVNGKAFRTNAAGLRNTLQALALGGEPLSPKGMQAVCAKAGARVTEDSLWCGSRDLIDIGLASHIFAGQKKLVQITDAGIAHMAKVLQASTAFSKAVWVDHTDGTVVSTDKENTVLGSWEQVEFGLQVQTEKLAEGDKPQVEEEVPSVEPEAPKEEPKAEAPKPSKKDKKGKK